MKIKALLGERIQAAFQEVGLSGESLLQHASRPEFGDYQANGVMAAAKRAGRNPRETAQAVVAALDLDGIAKAVDIAGPGFINITLDEGFLAEIEPLAVQTATPQTVVVDYSGPNLAKEMHVGHLRSTIIGDCIARVLERLGHRVIRQNHVGDWGTQFGMLLTYMQDKAADSNSLADLEAFYRLAKARFDDDEDFQRRSRQTVVDLQSGSPTALEQWARFIAISASHCQQLYDRLGIDLGPDDARGESSFNDDLAPTVNALTQRGLIELSDGAKCIFLDDFKNKDNEPLPVIVQKSDGGYLYATTDLAALRYRIGDLRADRILYFVDARQALHFKQIFAVARAAGIASQEIVLAHMPFGTMLGKDNKPFKTRQGDLIKLADLLDEAVERASLVLSEKEVQVKNPDIDDSEAAALADMIGIGAVKYADLSKNRTSDYVFDWDQMLSFEGNTAPYLQYAHSRIRSLFTRGEINPNDLPARTVPVDDPERRLAAAIANYHDLLEQVGQEGYPHHLCGYLYDLAGRFTQLYEHCPILNADQEARTRRLILSHQTASILADGLTLLGIRVPDRM